MGSNDALRADWNGDNWTPEQFAAWLEKQTWTDHSPHYGTNGAVVNPPYAKAAALIRSLLDELKEANETIRILREVGDELLGARAIERTP